MIRKDFKSIIYFYIQIIGIWIIAWSFFLLMRQYGIDEFPNIQFINPHNWKLHFYIHFGLGFATGILHGSIELAFEHPFFRKQSFGKLIIIKTTLFLFITYLLLILTVITYNFLLHKHEAIDWNNVLQWCTSITFLVGLAHFFMVSSLISIFRQLNYKCGPGILMNMLVGKYHHPREEERIFMFLDLKSSTTIAEKLGHIQFSRLIQDCFYDLTDIILMHDVEIYQYVGDEVILTWKVKKGIKENHCIAFYFDYKQKLDSKKDYYQEEYGVHPFFKAGIHLGAVTVAEVGVIKKEIAYLGDVVNTAARIQGRCNELDQELLISKDLKDKVTFNDEFRAKELGVQLLRGKQKQVAIFGVEKNVLEKQMTNKY